MRLFVSVPMQDRTEEEILQDYEMAVAVVCAFTKEEVEFIDVYNPEMTGKLNCLGEAIKKMQDADLVFFCRGWETHKGCLIEHQCAVQYGIPCMYE